MASVGLVIDPNNLNLFYKFKEVEQLFRTIKLIEGNEFYFETLMRPCNFNLDNTGAVV